MGPETEKWQWKSISGVRMAPESTVRMHIEIRI